MVLELKNRRKKTENLWIEPELHSVLQKLNPTSDKLLSWFKIAAMI